MWSRRQVIGFSLAGIIALAVGSHGAGEPPPATSRDTSTVRAAPPRTPGATASSLADAPVASHRPPARVALPPPVYPTHLPEGIGLPIAERSCLMCHSAMLITQQAKDSTGWEKTLTQMENWSAPLDAADRDTLLGYLLEHFGSRAGTDSLAGKPAPTH